MVSESAGGQLIVESQSDLQQIIHNLKNAVITPETHIIAAATPNGGSAVLVIPDHGLKSGDLVTVAVCAGGTFDNLNGTRRTVIKIDDDAIEINIAVSGTYTAASGTLICTTLADYLFDTFNEAVLKLYMGINPNNPPAVTNYPALFINPRNWSEEQITEKTSENKRVFILNCLIKDQTKSTVGQVTEFTGLYTVEKFTRLVMDYIKRYSPLANFGMEWSVENDGVLYYPEFQANITLTLQYGNPI